MNKKRQTPVPLPIPEGTVLLRLTAEQELELIKRARAGEDVRDPIILSLQRRVSTLASKYARPQGQEEFSDLVNSANVALLKHYQRALNHPNPYAYLLRVAQSTMINFYHGYGEHTQRERVSVLSLDETHGEDGVPLADFLSTGQTLEYSFLEDATAAFLRQTIGTLPEKQRVVIERHYGFGQVPESLNTIKTETSSKQPRSIDAHYQHKKALATLRASLSAQFPQYAEGGASQ